jgi:hypothetical protein
LPSSTPTAGYRDEAEEAKRARKRRKAELDFFMQLGGNEDDGLDFDPPSDGLTEFVARRAKVAATGQRCAALVDVPSAKVAGKVPVPSAQSATQTMNDDPHAMYENAPIARDQRVATMFSASASASATSPSVGNALRGVPNRTLSSRSRSASERVPVSRNTHARIAHRGRWWLAAGLLVACFFAGKAMIRPSASHNPLRKVSTVSSVAEKQSASQRIETIRVGQRVVSQTVGASAETQVDPRTWRLLRIRADHRLPDGTDDPVELDVLQPRGRSGSDFNC